MRSGPEPEVRPPYSVTFPAGRPAPEGYSVMLLPGGSGEAAKVGPFGAAPAGAPPGSAQGPAMPPGGGGPLAPVPGSLAGQAPWGGRGVGPVAARRWAARARAAGTPRATEGTVAAYAPRGVICTSSVPSTNQASANRQCPICPSIRPPHARTHARAGRH